MTCLTEKMTIAERWAALDNDRRAILARKREHSELSDPTILPPEGKSTNQPLTVPYNSLAAEGSISLASRITSVVWPLNGQSVFEIRVDVPVTLEGTDTTELDARLAAIERTVMSELARTNLRATVNLAYRHEQIAGDVLMIMEDDWTFRLFRADQYVVRRRHEGRWEEIIYVELVNPDWVPGLREKAAALGATTPVTYPSTSVISGDAEKWEPLFTQVLREKDNSEKVTQFFRGVVVGEETNPVSKHMPLRWSAVAGEPYGISHIESMFGDIRALDVLSKALLDGVVLNAEYRWGLNPNGYTNFQEWLDSVNGDTITTQPGELFPIQLQNHAQVQSTLMAVEHRERIVGRRFLMNSAIQPQGERVTARQVSILAQELESSLGGVLSHASQEIQEPVIRRAMYLLAREGKIPPEIVEQVNKQGGFAKIRIRAGLEILNREAEREKLDAAIERMRNLPPQALEVFNWTEIARDWWQSLGLDTAGRVKTTEELQEERAAMQQQALALQAAQAGVQAGLNQGEMNVG